MAHDVHGFAVKIYTQQGNWGSNIPEFFSRAIKFPDLIHAAKQEPGLGFPQAQTERDNLWDFISLPTELMHMAMINPKGRGRSPGRHLTAVPTRVAERRRSQDG